MARDEIRTNDGPPPRWRQVPGHAFAHTGDYQRTDGDHDATDLGPLLLLEYVPGRLESFDATGLRVDVLRIFHETPP
jgi:hypothetical protein